MANVFLIGLGAGAASALLFASIVSGNVLAILLFYLAALPIMLAAIAWSHMAGLVADTDADGPFDERVLAARDLLDQHPRRLRTRCSGVKSGSRQPVRPNKYFVRAADEFTLDRIRRNLREPLLAAAEVALGTARRQWSEQLGPQITAGLG